MLYIITFFLIIINMFNFKKSKLPPMLFLIFLGILFFGNINNPDYSVYYNIYNTNGVSSTENLEIGFVLLVKIGNLLKLTYSGFLALIFLIGLTLIHFTVKRYITNYSYFYLLYFFVPYFFDLVQIRNFILVSMLVFSIRFLIEESPLKYIFMIIIASFFHITALIYLPFVLITIIKNKKNLNYFIFCSIAISFIMLINNMNIPFWNELLNLANLEKLNHYGSSSINNGYLLFWGLQFLSFAMVYLSNGIINLYNNTSRLDMKMKAVKIIYYINLLAFLYLPFYLVDSNFTRFMRNLIIVNIIAFTITNETITERKDKIIYNILILLYFLVLFYSYLSPYLINIVNNVFVSNIFF